MHGSKNLVVADGKVHGENQMNLAQPGVLS